MSNTQIKERANVSFLAIDPYIETNIVSPTEKSVPGKDFIEWGTNNLYPDFLQDLYDNVATLRSVIDGCVDYIAGDDVTIILNMLTEIQDSIPEKKVINFAGKDSVELTEKQLNQILQNFM